MPEDTPNVFVASVVDPSLAYLDEYEKFMQDFRFKEVSGEEVGHMIARLASHFMKKNLILVRSLKIYTGVKRDIQNTVDEATGKPITSSKADTLASATPEAYAYEEAKVHVQNLEQAINALKALQKGVLIEYTHAE